MKSKFCLLSGILTLISFTFQAQTSMNKTPEWTSSADGLVPGLLPDLQLQVNTLYGHRVTPLGDINNDGYDDVAVSAPGMANVVAGSGTLLDVGAVFIYLGSSSGLSTTPAKVLQPTTAVAGALFGFSVAAGDVTGDGRPDILVGAPLDRYSTKAAGLLGDVDVNVTAGKVYMYRSEDLFSSSNPSPFLTIRLQGSSFFSTGVLGLLDNIDVNPLFGFSVATIDDVNGDNKSDIIIGCPAYLGINAVSAQAGAAFIYYSNNLGTASPLSLNVPNTSLLGLVSLPVGNIGGLLFGFSVDGAGDYNNDGYRDVIVGAPAGVDLSTLNAVYSGQFLGGSAYIYYGNGSAINPAIGAKLQSAPGSLLSSAANLFGYWVKGARGNAAARNGNVFVGAPNSSVLSNLVSGLKLKAGSVSVFTKKTGAFSSPVSPNQTLTSPRSSSVLSLLSGQTLDASLLYGASIDNTRDLNCDNINDIIIGEPLSTSVPVIGASLTGGAAHIYRGKADGTFEAAPQWSVYPTVSPALGVNLVPLFGSSVAGVGYTKGSGNKPRVMVGGPANALDYGAGLLDISNTLDVTTDFIFDNNGIGKSYEFNPDMCGLITLPVSLVHFAGYIDGKNVQLNWESHNENNFNYYQLEKSKNGVDFSPMAIVFGNNLAVNEYKYPDGKAFTGSNYYRLKMVDNDGKFKYSNIVLIRFDNDGLASIHISPNPVRNEYSVRMTGLQPGSYRVSIYSIRGELVQVQGVTVIQRNESIRLSGAKLSSNEYILQVYDDKGKKVGVGKMMVIKE